MERQEIWGEDNKKVKWQDIVQVKQVPSKKKKNCPTKGKLKGNMN